MTTYFTKGMPIWLKQEVPSLEKYQLMSLFVG